MKKGEAMSWKKRSQQWRVTGGRHGGGLSLPPWEDELPIPQTAAQKRDRVQRLLAQFRETNDKLKGAEK